MRLYLLSFGSNAVTGTPFPGYLIQTDDDTNILVDTGFPAEMVGAYRQPGREQGPKVDEADFVLNRLAAIDAIPRLDQRDPDTRDIGSYDMDEAGVRASTRKLMDLAEREGVTLIIHGHDAQQWASLKQAPDFYE